MSELLMFRSIKINIPRKEILTDLKKTYIVRRKFFRYRKLKRKLEIISSKVAHVSSLVERLLLKTYEYRA